MCTAWIPGLVVFTVEHASSERTQYKQMHEGKGAIRPRGCEDFMRWYEDWSLGIWVQELSFSTSSVPCLAWLQVFRSLAEND